MKKILSLLVVAFLTGVLFSLVHTRVLAVVANPKNSQNSSYKYSCLAREQLAGHRVRLTSEGGLQPNTPFYYLECFLLNNASVCTSGSPALDTTLFGTDNYSQLQTKIGYNFTSGGNGMYDAAGKSITNSVVADANGQVAPIEWQSSTPTSEGRRFLGLQIIPRDQTQKNTVAEGGQQQDTFVLNGGNSGCVQVFWDPYGRVFDSQSLEPVPGASVTLSQKTNGQYSVVSGANVANLVNPQSTIEDGAFSFIVPDGTYQLKVVRSGYVFPNEATKLSKNYAFAYFDIYRGEDIVQAGAIQHRDIPIDSTGTPYRGDVKLLSYSTILDKLNDTLIIQGRVTHPLTKINIYGQKPDSANPGKFVRTRLLLSTQADKQGQFDIRVNLDNLDPSEFVGNLEFIKIDLTTLQASPSATQPTAILEPIPNYLEGYAYDQNGNLMLNATVNILVNNTTKPYFETTTDDKGFFKIDSESLPFLPYKLRYTAATGSTLDVSPSMFISQNANYLTSNKIKLNSYFNKNGELVRVTPTASPNQNQAPSGAKNNTSQGAGVAGYAANAYIIAFVILLIIILVAVLLFYLKKRPDQMPPAPPSSPTTPTA